MNTRRWLAAMALGYCAAIAASRPAAAQTVDLTKLSLEDLLNTEITSVSRKEQTLSRTAAAVYVISDEDIRRSGAKTIPDLLRMVPGLFVAQIDATTWAITARGFNGLFANKLLVLIDGRSVYTPMFGGVHWEMQNLPLSDIERIEVIRGPGGTLWGANAVNGVINVITKTSEATQGGRVFGTFGVEQRGAVEARYGGRVGEGMHYRLYGKHSNRGSNASLEDFADPDGSSVNLGGMRIDWGGSVHSMTLQGSAQDGRGRHIDSMTVVAPPWEVVGVDDTRFTEGNVTFSWTRSSSSRSETGVQAYYEDYTRRNWQIGERWRTIDIDTRQRKALGRRHELVAGFGYRHSSTSIVNGSDVAFYPPTERSHLFTAFVQDELEVTDALRVTPGSKFEHNSFTGVEAQPSLRMTWAPTTRHSVWAAASRAVRTPTKVDRGVEVLASASPGFGGVPIAILIEGNPDLEAENLRALEAGYRVQMGRVSLDVTAFRNDYSDLKGTVRGAMRLQTNNGSLVRVIPLRFQNLLATSTHGAEATANWRPVEALTVTGSYAWLEVARPSGDRGVDDAPAPEHQFQVHSYLRLPANLELTGTLQRVAAVTALDIAGYTRVDARLGWPLRSMELAAGMRNLFHAGDVEFRDGTGMATAPIRAGAFGELSWRF